MADFLHITQRDNQGIAVLDLNGKLILGPEDLAVRETLASLLAAGSKNVILNFKQVSDVDSAAIGSLVSGATEFHQAGGKIAFLHLAPAHAQLPELLKLNTLFPTYQEEMDAVNSFFPDRVIPHYDILEFVEHLEAEKKDKPE